ncbi:MAG: flagellar hook assembly protein FlgD [Porticoccus sp.]|nr:flagellar hook assembly protein FlgD [Porticoccus sp.]
MESVASLAELFPSTVPSTVGTNKSSELGQEDFMELMVAQLKNQDPTSPQDNTEFLAQIAQFSTVSGVQELVDGFGSLSSVLYANQTLEAAGLVGRDVVTDSNLGLLKADDTLDATIEVPAESSGVTLYIQDISGRLVHSQALGPAAAGDIKLQWDGTDAEGTTLQPGQYVVSAEAVISGQNYAVPVYTHNQVQSVTVDSSGTGVLLNLDGGAQVGMSSVKSFL